MHQKSFAKNIESNYFAELLLVATSETRMILILFFSVNLHFLKKSSSVFFSGFQVVSYLSMHFYNPGLAVLETPLSGYFRPATIVFSKPHSDVIGFQNSNLFKLLARIAAINFPQTFFQ